jgi:hypothetical protein
MRMAPPNVFKNCSSQKRVVIDISILKSTNRCLRRTTDTNTCLCRMIYFDIVRWTTTYTARHAFPVIFKNARSRNIQNSRCNFEKGNWADRQTHIRSIVPVFELYISVQLRAHIVVLHRFFEMLKPGTIELPLPAFRKEESKRRQILQTPTCATSCHLLI